MKRIAFVTGGSGFIGRALLRALLEDDWQVRALVHESSLPIDDSRVQVVRGDLFDKKALESSLDGCDGLFHLAAKVSFAPSKRQQLMTINRDGTSSLLECAMNAGVKKVVVVSSACTLGVHRTMAPVSEDVDCRDEWRRRNPYLDSKRAQEEVCFDFHQQGLPVTMVLPTTVFGPGDDALNSGVFFQQVCKAGFIPVPSGGTSVVDVEDVARGILAGWARGGSGSRYVLTAENLSFRQVYETIRASCRGKAKLVSLPAFLKPLLISAVRVKSAVFKVLGRIEDQLTPQIIEDAFNFKSYSSEKAEKELLWHPQYSFAETVKRARAYYEETGLL